MLLLRQTVERACVIAREWCVLSVCLSVNGLYLSIVDLARSCYELDLSRNHSLLVDCNAFAAMVLVIGLIVCEFLSCGFLF